MKQPKVSIVIPVYNGEMYMREAIDSALQQTYENIEVLVVNDGSQDHTEEIALSYGDRIKYFSKKNGGVSTALNLGIEKMSGEYFSYLPHDDTLRLDRIEKQIEAILREGDETSIAWSGWNYFYQKTGKVVPFRMPFQHSDKDITKGIYPLLFGLLNTVTVLMPVKYFETAGKFDPFLYTSQDYDMWFRVFRGRKTIYVDEELVNYRMHEEQGSQADGEFIHNCEKLSKKMLDSLTKNEMEKFLGSEYLFYYYMLRYYQETGWQGCLEHIVEKFRDAKEPMEGVDTRRELQRYLLGCIRTDRVVLYCAGANGRKLLKELEYRGIEVSAFCDSDTQKQGTDIDGKRCVSIDELKKTESVILVTNDDAGKLKKELVRKGLKNLITYEECAPLLYRTIPAKERVLKAVIV